MKAINIKLATFSFAAMLLASCSDSNNNEVTNPSPLVNTKIVGSEVASSTDAQELASRVFNYKNSVSTTKTRAFDTNTIKDILDMPKAPTKAEIEADAKDKGFSYVHMDGNIGCMVNGAGLAMATMDMIKLYGGQPANFLDIGGSSNPVKVIEAMKLLLQDEKVKVVLINIFGGITRCDDVAMGLLQAFEQINSNVPVIVRLTGTNEHIGRELLRNYSRFQIATTMKEAALMALKA